MWRLGVSAQTDGKPWPLLTGAFTALSRKSRAGYRLKSVPGVGYALIIFACSINCANRA
jgi:hypothetical protein